MIPLLVILIALLASGTTDHTDNLDNLDSNDITDNDDITGHTYMFDSYHGMPCPQGLLGKCCVIGAPCPNGPFYVLLCELLLACKVQFKWHGCDWPWPQQQDDNAIATEGIACVDSPPQETGGSVYIQLA